MMKKMMKMMKMTVVSVLLAASVCLQRTVSEHRLHGTVGMELQWDCNYTGLITDIKTVSWQEHRNVLYQFGCNTSDYTHDCEKPNIQDNLVKVLCGEISSGTFSLIFKKPNMTQNNTKYQLRLALEKENGESKTICEVTLHLSDAVTPGVDPALVVGWVLFSALVLVVVGVIIHRNWKGKKNTVEGNAEQEEGAPALLE